MQRGDSLEMTLMLGKIEVKRRRGQQRMRLLDSIAISTETDKPLEKVEDTEVWRAAVHGVAKTGHNLAAEKEQQQQHNTEVQFSRSVVSDSS